MENEVEYLDSTSTGRWLVTTGHGTTHVFDLDAGTYERRPAPGRNALMTDHNPMILSSVERWPVVGETFFIWLNNDRNWQQSTVVASIEKFSDEED